MSLAEQHLDETGAPCARHPVAAPEALQRLALIGSRASGFHHDLASKLQGLMMAIDEIDELVANTDREVARATEAARSSLRDVLELLDRNRALTKPPTVAPIAVDELLAIAARRVHVVVTGDVPATLVAVSIPAMSHALALALNVAGGRSIPVSIATVDRHAVLTIAMSSESPATAAESLAIIRFVLARDHGELRCAGAGTQLVLRLPLAG